MSQRTRSRPPRQPVLSILASVALAFAVPSPAWLAAQGVPIALPSLAEPGISPDGTEIAFVSGGDIWTVPSTGGEARLLVAHPADEQRPLYAPDGRRLAFNSTREGGLDIYVMDLVTGGVSRLTYGSGAEQLNAWSRDGEWVYFSSPDEDIASMHDVFRVRATGGTPMAISADRYETEFFAAPAPSAGLLAVSTRGHMARGQWWRNGHSHIDEAEIWLVREGAPPSYEPLATGGKNVWPMWSPSGDRVFFMSDRSGSENLWSVPVPGGPAVAVGGANGEGMGEAAENGGAAASRDGAERLTGFERGRLLWPSIATQRPVIAFERDFGIWTYDAETAHAEQLDVRLVGSVGAPTPEVVTVTDDFDDVAVSPDGRKVAFVVRGEVFAAATEGDDPAARITRTPAAEGQVAWAPDSRRIVYTSWRNGTPQIFEHDFASGRERQLTATAERDGSPTFSPDGTYLAYNRAGNELRVIETATGADRLLAAGTSGGSSFTWSPDSRWIAYGGYTDEFSNAMVVPVDGGEPRQVSFLANASFGSIDWASTGEYLAFRTGQRTEPGRLVRVDLVPLTPTFYEDRFRDLFNVEQPGRPRTETSPARPVPAEPVAGDAPAPAAGPPAPPAEVDITFDGIRRRGYFVDLDFSVGSVLLSPDGEHAVVSGEGELYWISLEEGDGAEPRRLTPSGPGGGAQPVGFSSGGDELYLVRGGRIGIMDIDSGDTRYVDTSAEVEVDFERDKVAVFEQAWGEMRDGFYDPGFHGADWDRVREVFAPRAAGARTFAELSRILNLMLGELNASHLGHGGEQAGPDPVPTGRLGVRFDRAAYERDGRFRVSEMVPLGPADVTSRIAVGDHLLSLNGEALMRSTDLDRLLAGTEGEKVVARVARGADGEGGRDVELQPIGRGAERQLVYRAWVEGRRAHVDELSGGRLGYVHIASMSEGALDQLVFDLDQLNHAKEGVVVDVRNNNGGFVNVYAIDIFSRRNYFTMRNRGGVVAPSRVQLGQRALLAPTVLVTNQHTLSDGEDFTEGYRSLGLGKVVGEPTAGWIIYTGSASLVDGSSVRMPRVEIRDGGGRLMELSPRPVDVVVERRLGESYHGRDAQLERAVEELLADLGGATRDSRENR